MLFLIYQSHVSTKVVPLVWSAVKSHLPVDVASKVIVGDIMLLLAVIWPLGVVAVAETIWDSQSKSKTWETGDWL